jgi:predicted phage gp36 major capsid-like protein
MGSLKLASAGGEAMTEEVFDASRSRTTKKIAELKKKGATDPRAARASRQDREVARRRPSRPRPRSKPSLAAEEGARRTRAQDRPPESLRPQRGERQARSRDQVVQRRCSGASPPSASSAFTPLDAKGYDAYKAAFDSYMRKNERVLTPEEVKTLSVGSDPDGGYLSRRTSAAASSRRSTRPRRCARTHRCRRSGPTRSKASKTSARPAPVMPANRRRARTPPRRRSASGGSRCSGSTPSRRRRSSFSTTPTVDVEGWLSGKVGDKFGRFENAEFVTGAANKIRGFMLATRRPPTPARA